MDLLVFGIVCPWLLVGFGCWLGYQLVRQNGRILLRLEALEERLGELRPSSGQAHAPAPAAPTGLPVGTIAPEFELLNLAGLKKALSEFQGKRLLLTFFNPRCGFCVQMADDLAALPTDGRDGRPVPLVVSTGDAAENRQFFEEHGIRCPVLLQEQMEIGALYQAHGTPMGYLIDENGKIDSEIAVGSQALLALAEPGAGRPHHRAHKGNRNLTDSKIARNGLAAGTPAPDFTLPTLYGEELSLLPYRGRKVLLVFSDPKCGPCMSLAPQLEEAHRRSGGVQVLMVSRGDLAANREKAEEQGLSFPIALQKQWEVSKAYAMFATPVAYLIDEQGVIAADVATGVEAILALLVSATTGEPEAARRCGCGKTLGECGCGMKNSQAAAVKPRRQ